MSGKLRKKAPLSAIAHAVAELMNRIADGNQREFARMIGCAQPVISRIVNGKQQPSRELLERIGKLNGVDRDALIAALELTNQEEEDEEDISETQIPVAQCLLDGPPASRSSHFTTSTVAVSPAVFRHSLYAVSAKACEPAFSDPSERFRGDDLIVIESLVDSLRKNLQGLNGKLCVVVIRGSDGDTITLRRVWLSFENQKNQWCVRTCPDSKLNKLLDEKFGGKFLREIELDLPESPPAAKYIAQPVGVSDIVGVAIQLIRTL